VIRNLATGTNCKTLKQVQGDIKSGFGFASTDLIADFLSLFPIDFLTTLQNVVFFCARVIERRSNVIASPQGEAIQPF
jgi:hypothetical protein